jgi:hypothetical protein
MTYDPVLEAFDQLEREIAARELRARQAACAHEETVVGYTLGNPMPWKICTKCGLVSTDKERARADLDAARMRSDFLPTMCRL